MKLIKESILKDGSGTVTLVPEDPEDMWSAYNLIRPKDRLRAMAVRRVVTDGIASTSSARVHTELTITVTSTHFDAQASTLNVSGTIVVENAVAKKGQYHTLDLELNRKFTIEKAEGWDSVAVEMVRNAVDVSKGASAWAVVMQEGLAHICALMGERTVLRQKVEVAIPRKRTANGGGGGKDSGHDKGLQRFYETLCETLLRQIDLTESLPILLASPGFTAQGFLKYVLEYASRSGNKALSAQKPNFLVTHASSGYLHALDEVLASQAVLNRLKDTQYARETRLMNDFFELLRVDDGRAWYGPNEVKKAIEKGAVGQGGGVFFVSNKLFRSLDVSVRREWVAWVDRVREHEGGEVRILSSEHESGKRLEGLGGVAAILTFPLDDLADDDEDGETEGGGVDDL